tara:strand:- start:892 stop:2394 length:1503 start_codon:yes stop_codon:yes gene_type:complete
MSKEYQDLIKRRHPEYKTLAPHWEFLDSCYRGGRGWFQDNIFRYMKEGDTEYKDRVARAYRFNHTREVVDLLNKYIFRVKPNRNEEDAPDFVNDFWSGASRSGRGIEYLMRHVAKRSSTMGRIYMVIDNDYSGGSISIRDEETSESSVYAYTVNPTDVLDMSYDSRERLNWILIREVSRDDEDPMGGKADEYYRYRLWTRESWFLFEESGETVVEIDSGDHSLGLVPVIAIDHMEDDSLYSAPALIGDVAYLDRSVANYLSDLDAIIQDQTFSQLTIPAQAFMPGDEQKAAEKLVEMGTKRIFVYNAEGGASPSFIAPDPRQAKLIITAVQQLVNEIYHTVGMAGERTKQDNSAGIDNSSGVAKAYDFERVNALLTNKAATLQRAEHEMLQIVAAWNGYSLTEEELASYVVYPENFDARGLIDEFDVSARLQLVSAPDEIRRKQMELVVKKLFPGASRKDLDAMMGDIESWPPEMDLPSFSKSESEDSDSEASEIPEVEE